MVSRQGQESEYIVKRLQTHYENRVKQLESEKESLERQLLEIASSAGATGEQVQSLAQQLAASRAECERLRSTNQDITSKLESNKKLLSVITNVS